MPAAHDIVIAGGGPVGLTLAAALARYGIPSVVLEQRAAVSDGSRAICLSRRTLEILDWIGVGARVSDKGLGWTRGRAFHRERVVHELTMPHAEDDRHYPMTNLQQYYLEQFLVDHCRATGLVDLRWQTRVDGVAQSDDRVSAETTTGPVQAAWLVATDGGRSSVRQALGLKLQGASYEGSYVICDIEMRSDQPTERRAWFDPPSNPGSTVLMHKQPDDIWRIDYQLGDGEDPVEALQPARVEAHVADHLAYIGETAPWRSVWISLYQARSLALDSYRHGRVLFAGDAAHLVPIFGVRGLNSGIADAHNLAWKLAFVLRGSGGDALLTSYAGERRAATLDIFRATEKSTRFMTPATKGHRLLREAVLDLAAEHPFVRVLIDPRQSVPFTYQESALNAGSNDPSLNGLLGALLPDAPLLDGDRPVHLLALFDLDFAELSYLGGDAWQLREVGSDRARRLRDPAGTLAGRLDAEPGTLYLIRPDHHVCGAWRRPERVTVEAGLLRARGYEQ